MTDKTKIMMFFGEWVIWSRGEILFSSVQFLRLQAPVVKVELKIIPWWFVQKILRCLHIAVDSTIYVIQYKAQMLLGESISIGYLWHHFLHNGTAESLCYIVWHNCLFSHQKLVARLLSFSCLFSALVIVLPLNTKGCNQCENQQFQRSYISNTLKVFYTIGCTVIIVLSQ